MEIIRNLVDSIGRQEAPGRPQLWEADSQVLRNEGVTATDKNALMNLYSFSFAERNANIFKITALVRHTDSKDSDKDTNHPVEHFCACVLMFHDA